MAEPHPVLLSAYPGQFVGVRVRCPRATCDWTEDFANAVAVNEYGVRAPMPDRCGKCGLRVEVCEIVELI